MSPVELGEACMLGSRTGTGILWSEESGECFQLPGFLGQPANVAADWQQSVPALLASYTQTVQEQRENLRIDGLERRILMLQSQVHCLQRCAPVSVVVDTMAPEPIDVIRPFHVVVEPYEDEMRASFDDANLSAFGETRNEAIWNLKDLIAGTFEILDAHEPEQLGPGPARQLEVLKQFIKAAE
jgi:predicted RNase H-like HicB family nuclease